MFYQPSTPPPPATIVQSSNSSCITPTNVGVSEENEVITGAIATPSPPETLPPEFSTDATPQSSNSAPVVDNIEHPDIAANDDNDNAVEADNQELSQQFIAQKTTETVKSENLANSEITNTKAETHTAFEQQPPQSSDNLVAQESKTSTDKNTPAPSSLPDDILANAKNVLVGVFINGQEVGSLELVPENNTLLIPLDDFARIAGIEIVNNGEQTQLKTPLGVVSLTEKDWKKIDGITYISDSFVKEKLLTNLELKTSDLALNVDLPWRRGSSGDSRNQALELKPEVRPPSSGLSNLRQELNYYNSAGDSTWRSSTLLGGRLGGGAWRLRLENNFVNQPNLTEYFYFKRSGRSLYQIGKQQFNLNPVLSGLDLTGVQFGYTNIPAERFNTSYSATELFPRRSQPSQAFRGIVPPASFVQLRVGGVIIAQQQVGLNGEYDFQDVLLPVGQTNEIELLVFERNNPTIPIEVRSLSINSSDLLLPSGGNVQLAGLGLTGNWLQNSLFDDYNSTRAGRLAGFYQVRQGVSNNLTLEAGVQALPEVTQAQAGFAWRLANPLILSANVGTSFGELAYKADLDFKLDNWKIVGVSEFYPQKYFSNISVANGRDRQNHSLDVSYKFSNNFTLGFIARSYQSQGLDSNYILPTFSFRPANNLYLRGTPNFVGDYVFNALYQPSRNTRLLFNAYGDVYSSDLSYEFNREYRLSFGTESGGDLATRYTMTFGRTAPTLSGLSWRLGLGYREDEIGLVAGANIRLIPGLYASVDYQGIPSRYKNIYGGAGDERFTISLVSDLSFSGGRITPSEYSSISRDTGAIAGRMVINGGRNGTDLSGGIIRVYDKLGRGVGVSQIDPQGNFFVGNLREGNYVVQIDPDELPIELNLRKTVIVAEVASSAVTQLDFPVRLEYGMAGKITDVSGQPMAEVELEVIDAEGKRVTTAMTDQFGLYRIDGLPVGKYTLRVPQQANITNSSDTLPQLEVAISKDFIYDQNLRLPISAAVKQIQE